MVSRSRSFMTVAGITSRPEHKSGDSVTNLSQALVLTHFLYLPKFALHTLRQVKSTVISNNQNQTGE